VLHEVRQSKLILLLEDGSGFQYQAQFSPILRRVIGADHVGQAVVQGAVKDRWIERNLILG